MEDKYILAVDQSTSATKAILFDALGQLVKRTSTGHKQYYPQPGWVEHDPEEIYGNTLAAIRNVLKDSGIPEERIKVLAITNQRETVVVWNRQTGKPVGNAVVWQCQRGKDICRELKSRGLEEVVRAKTGLIIDPYFSASGISWILRNNPEARKLADAGDLVFGTIDTWLVWKLTGGEVHASDYSNACRTMLFNIHELQWDQEIMELLGIPLTMAPEVKPADEVFGHTTIDSILREPLPIAGILGDSHAAFLAQLCFERGTGKATYGTGSSVMMNIGDRPLDSPEGLVTSVGFGLNGRFAFVYEGNIHCTGCTIKWLIDEVGLITGPEEAERLAASLDGNEGVYLVPAFAGLGAPYWNNEARAVITGMSRGTGRAHLARAALEAIAYQVKDLVDLMREKSGIKGVDLRVDGGPTRNDFLMQFQADMLDCPLSRSGIEEASALGSALAGGLATGVWKDLEELKAIRDFDRVFTPRMKEEQRSSLYLGWKKAIEKTIR
jgi:glycerol kinase